MKTSISSFVGLWCITLFLGCCHCCRSCAAFNHVSSRSKPSSVITWKPTTLLGNRNSNNTRMQRQSSSLMISTVDADLLAQKNSNSIDGNDRDDSLLIWNDIVPLSLYTTMCLVGAILISTYEDFDVTHTRPSPSTLRLPTSSSKATSLDDSWNNNFNFLGAATKGLGWGPSNRGAIQANNDDNFFEEWYGTSAMTLQFKPSYNEIMLEHRSERVPRWNTQSSVASKGGVLGNPSSAKNVVTSKEQLQQAVLKLYQSLDELDELKLMADDYNWEGMKEHLNPTTTAFNANPKKNGYALPTALEYSMDILKSMPSYYASSSTNANPGSSNSNLKEIGEVPELIGFDWGSCAWRHCGAKADAQEAIAELYSNVGMLEPFECRFIIDVVERSIRDVLTVVLGSTDDLKPLNQKNGAPMQVKPYDPYVSKASEDGGELGIDYEYAQVLNGLRIDLSGEE